MSESLPAINIEELTDAVNAVVNMKQREPTFSNIVPNTPISTTAYRSFNFINQSSNDFEISNGSRKIPVMVSVLPSQSNNGSSTLCLANISNYSKVNEDNTQSNTGGSNLPLSVMFNGESTPTLVDVNNINTPLPPFTTQTFSSQPPPTDLSTLDTEHHNTNNNNSIYNTSNSSDIHTTQQINSASTPIQTSLPSLIFSPSETNTANRFFMTSPLPIFSVDTPIPSVSSYPPRPLSVVSNISGISVFDSLIKANDNVQFLAPLPPVNIEKSGNNHNNNKSTDLSKRTLALPDFYCVECRNCIYTQCKHHSCIYEIIEDKPILSRAKQTLPNILQLKTSHISGHFTDLGIYTTETIPKMTVFGPLVGRYINNGNLIDTNIFKHWKIFYKEDEDINCDILDISDENSSNWLMFIKPARDINEQNVIVYQTKDSLMFVTIKDIEPNEELLFWFSKEYAKLIGFLPKPSQLKYCPYCKQCDKIYPDKISLVKHNKEQHTEKPYKKFKCQYCEKHFSSVGKLKGHVLTCHTNIKPFNCTLCGKKFSDQSNLRSHSTIHTGEKKFTCSVCSKTFRQKAHLTSHMHTHTKIKDVPCPHCDKKFSRVADMKQHTSIHTQDKIFQCSQCSKIFYKIQTYKKHLKIHTNEKNFSCGSCLKKFFTKYHLDRHLKSCKSLKMNKMLNKLSEEENIEKTADNNVNSIYMESLTQCNNNAVNSTENQTNHILRTSCDSYDMNSISDYNIGLVNNNTDILNTPNTAPLPSISHVVHNTLL